MLIDQSPFEAVIALQRLDLASDTRAIVDEAASLLNDGREGEARALLEKAEALVALRDAAGKKEECECAAANEISKPALQGIIAPLAAKLASGFTNVLTSVLEDIHVYAGDQIQVVAKSLQDHIENMQAALRNVSGVGERLEQLANEQHASLLDVQRGQEELWNAVRALQQADGEQIESISRVTAVTQELAGAIVNQADAVSNRFAALEERVSILDRFASEIPPQFDGICARLDGHTEALRALELRQTQRVSTLNQVLETLSKLKEPESPEVALPAVA